MTATRIAVLGAGVIVRRHVRTLTRFPDVRVCAVADVLVDRAKELATGVGAQPYDDPRAMLNRERPDGVYVCVPPFAHGDLDLDVVQRGLPMFVEKPVAADLTTAERIATAVEQAGLMTAVGHHWRWLVVAGFWLDATPPIGWWQRQDGSGGQFVEQATHVVDLARLLVGRSTRSSPTPRGRSGMPFPTWTPRT